MLGFFGQVCIPGFRASRSTQPLATALGCKKQCPYRQALGKCLVNACQRNEGQLKEHKPEIQWLGSAEELSPWQRTALSLPPQTGCPCWPQDWHSRPGSVSARGLFLTLFSPQHPTSTSGSLNQGLCSRTVLSWGPWESAHSLNFPSRSLWLVSQELLCEIQVKQNWDRLNSGFLLMSYSALYPVLKETWTC